MPHGLEHSGLTPLSDMDDYEVADGYVDVRGFEVWDEEGNAIGEVDDLLVDPASESVRALVIELDEDAVSGMTNEEEIRIPLDAVTILEDDEAVRLRRPIGDFAPGLESGGMRAAGRAPAADRDTLEDVDRAAARDADRDLAERGRAGAELLNVDREPTAAPRRDLPSDPVPTHPRPEEARDRDAARPGLTIEPGPGGDVVYERPPTPSELRIRRRVS
jgi:sporulation protein YlmC with PRC-barrel domain